MINLNQTAIDVRDLNFDKFLSNLQGNILKGHGRDNTVHIFSRFKPGKIAEVKAWLQNFTKQNVTSCKEQLRQRELFKRNGTPGSLFAGLYLTAKCYEYLGLPTAPFGDPSFKAGMKNADLDDPPVASWEPGYQQDVHAMILLADDDLTRLGKQSKIVLDELDLLSEIIDVEYGSAIRNANGDGLEHFGYVDGISQPLFLKDEIDNFKAANLALRFDPSAQLSLALVDDPHTGAEDAFGSYFVFRKLEQNVRGFKKAEEKVAEILGLEEEDEERAGAMIVGRFEDGTPVTLSKTDHMIASGIMNNFDYKEKIEGVNGDNGSRCPFHAHIRKTNPRTSEGDKKRIMARRGITYGHRNVNTTIDQTFVQMPKEGVGLLFMSFQKSLVDQFEFIQKSWANNVSFPSANTGIDPIIGQGNTMSNGKYAKKYNDKTTLTTVPFDKFVTMKGGEYFFAPSIPFLKNLA